MYKELKERVCRANIALKENGLVALTWGNVSECDRERKIFAIKPSGVPYDVLKPEDIVIVNFDGDVVEGDLNPSSDAPTHAELYRRFPSIGGVTHTHSRYATAWAQAGRSIPAYGTTHADFAHGEVPCTRPLTAEEINGDYELETGRVIADLFESSGLEPLHVPAVLVSSHGPFTWGKNGWNSMENAIILEEVGNMALQTELLSGGKTNSAPSVLLDKHFMRKHGPNAYYGQKKK